MDKIDDQDKNIEDKHSYRDALSHPVGTPMPQPQLRADAIANALNALKSMEDRRGAITMLDGRRLDKLLGALDQSFESQTAYAMINAQWERDFDSFDAAAMRLLEADGVSSPQLIYVNFALMCLHALSPAISIQLNRRAFEAGSNDLDLLPHVLSHAWHAGDLDLYRTALTQFTKLDGHGYQELEELYDAAIAILYKNNVSLGEYQQHIQDVSDAIRPFIAGQSEIRLGGGIDIEQYDDESNEILYEVDIDLDSEQMDRLDDALLNMLSDRSKVSAALNKSVGVLVRDYPHSAEAEAC